MGRDEITLDLIEACFHKLYLTRSETMSRGYRYISGLRFSKHYNTFGETYDCILNMNSSIPYYPIFLVTVANCVDKIKKMKTSRIIEINKDVFYSLDNDGRTVSLNCRDAFSLADYVAAILDRNL